nr:MAG TPA: capsid scaffolding protein [Caudoviricetes sp.]
MKKRMIYLKQLFEDGGAGSAGAAGADDKGGQEKPEGQKKGTDSGKDAGGEGDKGADEKKYSDADLDQIIGKKFAEWQKKQQKAVDEAKKLAEMNAQEKAEYERDQLQKELDALKKSSTLAEMGKTARKMLSDDGLNVPDDLVSMIITEDAETTKANVQQFSKLFKVAVQDAVKDALKGKAPSKGGSSTMTKEDIMKVKDRVERQRLIAEHMDLFK